MTQASPTPAPTPVLKKSSNGVHEGTNANNGNGGRKVYVFKKGYSPGNKSMKQLLGGKGANLCEMAKIGLNVPAGFTISTEVCADFNKLGGKLPEGLWEEITDALGEVERAASGKFADESTPLLVSVRSGAAISMPGMMDTVLNLGLNDTIVKGVAAKYGERFAYDSYRRLLDMFGDVVLGIEHSKFEKEISALKAKRGVKHDVELTAEDLKELVEAYKGVYASVGQSLPEDPLEQLRMAICAVFKSWMTPRAVKYREINKITGLKGTAVNVQSMVYGNLGDSSGTGVFFTRSPATGINKLYGEFLANAQGEDVVAGIRTPLDIDLMKEVFPEAYAELVANAKRLENHMHDMQDCEFTVQEGTFFMLQTRNGKRTGAAALKVAVDLFNEGLVTKEEAVQMVEPRHLDQLLHPNFADPKAYKKSVIATGLPASPGAALGRVVFTAEDAEKWKSEGEQVILVRVETSPEDVGGMHAAEGILTARGGMTSHAAVVARGWGKPCICGCETLDVDHKAKVATCGGTRLEEGTWISLNGTTGEVILGKQELSLPSLSGELAAFMEWVDSFRRLGVQANADTPNDAAIARRNGAEGIGLARTEHMFFSTAERIGAMRRMIAAEELAEGRSPDDIKKLKSESLNKLKSYQKADFEGMFQAMDGLPVTIRLLDPPLHEFLPKEGTQALIDLCNQIAKLIAISPDLVHKRIGRLAETNPMMGLRGCRLGIVHSDITQMQVAAILEAAVAVQKRGGKVYPHIMVPLVGVESELLQQVEVIKATAEKVFAEAGARVEYEYGTMIEVPRGALQAGVLAQTAQFFSFGTNDLTQMTFGFSRDDAEAKFLPLYVKTGILPCDPFQTIDEAGVGELIRIAVERGRATNPNIGLGVCGEHGGDPQSVAFFDKVGVDYVSCSPLRVPIARLAAAQAAIKARPSPKGQDDHCQD